MELREEGLTPERRDEILQYFVKKIQRYGLVAPAIFFLQMTKPLSFIGSQATFAFSPFAELFINVRKVEEFAWLLNERENVERL
ncbi:MAG: hypothetical protein Q8N36_04210, partial [bacterium]|nr:hypothetical protein [bacterium]